MTSGSYNNETVSRPQTLLRLTLLLNCGGSNQVKHGCDNIQGVVIIGIRVFVGEFFNPLTRIPVGTDGPLRVALQQGVMDQFGSVDLFFQLP